MGMNELVPIQIFFPISSLDCSIQPLSSQRHPLRSASIIFARASLSQLALFYVRHPSWLFHYLPWALFDSTTNIAMHRSSFCEPHHRPFVLSSILRLGYCSIPRNISMHRAFSLTLFVIPLSHLSSILWLGPRSFQPPILPCIDRLCASLPVDNVLCPSFSPRRQCTLSFYLSFVSFFALSTTRFHL